MADQEHKNPARSLWDVPACLNRADKFLSGWMSDRKESAALLHAAFELRLALEAYVMDTYERASGEEPRVHGVSPIEAFFEIAQFNEEAMTPQTWSIGVMEETRGNSSAFTLLGYSMIRYIKARDYYTRLTELLHAGQRYEPAAQEPTFWDRQYSFLRQVHADLTELFNGQPAKPATDTIHHSPGAQQSGIL
jgi:hypothetical protein